MRTIIFILLLLQALPILANEKPKEDMSLIIDMMIVAKATGMCGTFTQMITFQETTKMTGGDEFIIRFLSTEAVRLGHTLDSFMAQCPNVVKKYNTNMKLLGFEQ